MQTASASTDVLASRQESLIDEAIRRITEALESDVAFHTSLNISDSTIVSDSVVHNSEISNSVRRR